MLLVLLILLVLRLPLLVLWLLVLLLQLWLLVLLGSVRLGCRDLAGPVFTDFLLLV